MPSARRKHWTLLSFCRFCRLFDNSKQINSQSIVTVELPDTVDTDVKVCGCLVCPEGTGQSLRLCFVRVMSLFTVINKHSEMFETQNSVCVLTAVTLALPGSWLPPDESYLHHTLTCKVVYLIRLSGCRLSTPLLAASPLT